MSRLKQTLAASVLSIAGAAGSASAADLTENQEAALSLAQGYNQCVYDGYQDPALEEAYQAFEADAARYIQDMDAYALQNGYVAEIEALQQKANDVFDDALRDGVLTDEEYAAINETQERYIELEQKIIDMAAEAGIIAPQEPILPEDSCLEPLQQNLEAQGLTLESLDQHLGEAYDALGNEELFFDRIAPSMEP